MSDPFRTIPGAITGDDLAEALRTAPVGRHLARDAVADMSRITGSLLTFIQADNRRAWDDQQAQVFGERLSNRISPAEAKTEYGLTVDKPINRHTAGWMHEERQRAAFNEEMAARGGLSLADTFGASIWGTVSDPVQMPFLFAGGEGALLKGLGIRGAGRAISAFRGAAVGSIDGIAANVAIEVMDQSVKRAADRPASIAESFANVAVGAGFGAVIGGVTGAVVRPIAQTDLRAAMRAQETGRNPARISADPPGPGRGGAVGALQLLPETARRMAARIGVPFDENRLLHDVAYNTRLSDEYMGVLTQRYDGDQFLAVTAYHAGEGNVDGWLRRHGDPRTGAVSREAWLAKVEVNNPRSARYPREVFARMGVDINGGGAGGVHDVASPRALSGLTDNEKTGSALAAVDALMRDQPVDVAPMLARNGLDVLDEASAVPSIRGRWLEADAAVTRRGSEIPVRFAVVELADLKTSHTDDLTPEADYPTALQPRDRARPGAQAENYNLERDLNPALLMKDKAASAGAPIVSPDGLVESGNGRTIALRRSAQTGTEAWGRYAAELQKQGIDTTGFDRPVLVRMRSEPMTGAARADLASEMNVSAVEGFSPVEQARADARRLDADTLGLIEGDDAFAAANRPFLKGFVQKVAPNDANALTDAKGALSLSGKARVQAALVQKAYGSDLLTASLFETGDPSIRTIGTALADAAPAWARMRAEAPAVMDITDNLTNAVALVREARANRMSVGELLGERLGQTDLFGGQAISPETEAMIRLMFRDEALTKPRGAERIAEALRDYARGAAETPAGPDLFGVEPDGRAFLDTLLARYAGAEGDGQKGLAYAGGSEPAWTTREAEAPGLDLRPAEIVGDRPGGQGDGQGGGGEVAGTGGRIGPEIVGELPARGVAPAFLGKDGKIYAGLIGTQHFTAVSPELRSVGQNGAGFVNAKGDFLTREEALVYVNSTGENIKPSENMAGELDAMDYREQSRFARADGEAAFNAAYRRDNPKPEPKLTPQTRLAEIIAADPELKALMADTEALARAADIDLPPFDPSTEPSTIAEAVRAAAFCLASDLVV